MGTQDDSNVDMQDESTSTWTHPQADMLSKHLTYHQEMTTLLETVLAYGTAFEPKLPKKPAGNLLQLLGFQPAKAGKLFGMDLHEYLVNNIGNVAVTADVAEISDEVNKTVSLDNVIEHLKTGFNLLKKQQAKTLSLSIKYGQWLETAFELFNLDKLRGRFEDKTWAQWLHETVGIKDSYARKLREIAKLLGQYPGFNKLGLSVSEVYNLKNQIKTTLATFPVVAAYWKKP